MDKELVDIVLNKSFVELTTNERTELLEWCSNEDEFDQMKNVFLEVELMKKQQTENVRPETKRSLDALFDQKHGKGSIIWNSSVVTALYPKEKPIYKRPLFQIAAACILFFMAYPIISNKSELKEVSSIAKNEKSFSELDEATSSSKEMESSLKEVKSTSIEKENLNTVVNSENQMDNEVSLIESDVKVESTPEFDQKIIKEEEKLVLNAGLNNSASAFVGATSPVRASLTLKNKNMEGRMISNLSKSDKSSNDLESRPDGLYDESDKDQVNYSKSVSDNSSILDLLTVTF